MILRPAQEALHWFLLVSTILTISISSLHFICFPTYICYPKYSSGNDAGSQWGSSNSVIACDSLDDYFFFCPSKSSDGDFLVKGFAVPLFALTCLTYLLSKDSEVRRLSIIRGDPNVTFWTLIIVGIPTLITVGLPLVVIFVLCRPDPSSIYRALGRLLFLGGPTGNAAVIALTFFLIPVAKHSPILKIFGLSHSQALEFHRLAGWISFVCTIVHSIIYCIEFGLENEEAFFKSMISRLIPTRDCWSLQMPHVEMERRCYILWMNFTGLASTLAFVVLAVTSLYRNRRRMYRLFYLIHIPCAWIMLLGAIAHITYNSLFLFPGILFYLVSTVSVWVDQLSSRHGYQLESIQEIPDSNGCYEIRIPNNCAPSFYGEVVKICAPKISLVWHPFSVVRDPKNQRIMICIIRGVGNFTMSLRQRLVDETISDESVPLVSSDECVPKLLVDGPYPAEYRWHKMSHTTMLLVAGGVGIVPFLSLLTNLHANPEDKVRRIVLHWYCREVTLAKHIVESYLGEYDLSNTSSENDLRHDLQQDQLTVELFIHITSRSGSSPEDVINEIRTDALVGAPISHLSHMRTRVLTDPQIALQPSHTSKWSVFFKVSGLVSACFSLHWWYYEHFVHQQRTILPRIYIILLIGLVVLIANVLMLLARRIGTPSRPQGSMLLTSHPMEREDESNENSVDDDDSQENHSTDPPLRVIRKMQIAGGRPSPTVVVSSVLDSDSGAFFCGPKALRTSVKGAIFAEERRTAGLYNRFRCAIYDEESEM